MAFSGAVNLFRRWRARRKMRWAVRWLRAIDNPRQKIHIYDPYRR